jgi:hypothetical protein
VGKAIGDPRRGVGGKRIRWSGKRTSRRLYEAICDIPVDIRKDELERRIKAFGVSHGGIAPTIHLHGIPFRAVLPDPVEG